MAILFLQVDDNAEIRIEITRREYNGIETDPVIRRREPSLDDIRTAVAAMHRSISNLSAATHLIGRESNQETP